MPDADDNPLLSSQLGEANPQEMVSVPSAAPAEEVHMLRGLATSIRDQDELERNIHQQADHLLTSQANERDEARLAKANSEITRLQNQLQRLRFRQSQSSTSRTAIRTVTEVSRLEHSISGLLTDVDEISRRIEERGLPQKHPEPHEPGHGQGNQKLSSESQRDFLIRTGKITPFSKLLSQPTLRTESSLEGALLNAEEGVSTDQEILPATTPVSHAPLSHRDLVQPGFCDALNDRDPKDSDDEDISGRPLKRPRTHNTISRELRQTHDYAKTEQSRYRQKAKNRRNSLDSEVSNDSSYSDGAEAELIAEKGDHDQGSSEDDINDGSDAIFDQRANLPRKARNTALNNTLDDGNEKVYNARLNDWSIRRAKARSMASREHQVQNDEAVPVEDMKLQSSMPETLPLDHDECFNSHPTVADHVLEGGYKLPGDIHPSLFDYQKTGVQWLWELYSQSVGGIVGDEMGLGKTIQVIAFLAGLHFSNKLTKPVIIVTPATVMKQWVNEFHKWWPPFRVSILHTSGSGMIDISGETRAEASLSHQNPRTNQKQSRTQKLARQIVSRVVEEGHILITTYAGLQNYAELLLPIDWEYAVLDEGHNIRNPNAAITIYCKELRTANRIILSGTPMQNNLVELWSLFDFIFPMRLGTLISFRNQFEIPIRTGGYANASNLQVQAAMRCAEMLKDTISPYLLQRFKADVASDLPKKSEQVLFCKLTKCQRDAYEGFLGSDDLRSIMNGKRHVLYGIDILRKICNHPDLVEHKTLSVKPSYSYGNGAKSGKMQVVKALLELWKEQGHKTLLFAQHRIMLDILEKFLSNIPNIKHRRMDGTTTIALRQSLVDEFNNNPGLHVFLLTTKVGGLGVNLTGADRVIIFDPDWNPSTDMQARERAWRLGQKREVMIYRLMTAGTIEEKIYHRQLFKQFLINKIMRDPKQRQTFQMKDLHDLFTLGGDDKLLTETGEMFKGSEVKFDAQEASLTDSVDPHVRGKNPNQVTDTISQIQGVDRLAEIQDDTKESVTAADAAAKPQLNSDAHLMQGLFARSGVQAALEHDQIVNPGGRTKLAPDPKMIEREAQRIAAKAASELERSREAAKLVPIGTPTWTGEFGIAGRPQARPIHIGVKRSCGTRAGPSSTSILARLQSPSAPNLMTSEAQGVRLPDGDGTTFIKIIRDFLISHGGSAHTQMLIDHFNRFCRTPSKTAEFKAMLAELAILQKGTGGRGKWILKEKYRDL